jgi:hypothetical protein
MLEEFIRLLTPNRREEFLSFRTPADIQAYLDSFPYVGEDLNRSPLRVMHDQQGHCLDGGLLAALALRSIGFPAQVIDLVPEPDTDDDHVLAIFQIDGYYGAVAKSNYAGLRYREPIHRSLRELALTYFEDYYNLNGLKSLRGYTRPLRLDRFDSTGWMWDEAGVEAVSRHLYRLRSIPLLNRQQVSRLLPVDERAYQAGMIGTDINGVYKPKS